MNHFINAYLCLRTFQKLCGDQKFWLTTTLLLSEASLSKIDKNSTLLDRPDPHAANRVRFSLTHGFNCQCGLPPG